MEKYFLVYPQQEDWQKLSWCYCEKDLKRTVNHGSLAEFKTQANGLPIMVILPGIWLNMFTVMLPKGRAAQVKKALPFLLEEQLVQDLEEVHIALPTQYSLGQEVPVAVISKPWMQTLLALAKENQLNMQQALPDWLCLPLFDNTWTIHLSADHAYVRQGSCLGFSVQKSMLMPMLNLAISQAAEKPQSLHIFHLALAAADMEEQLAALNVPLAYEAVNEDPMELWVQNVTIPSPLNLLQGDFYIKPKANKVMRLWRVAGALAAAIVLVMATQSSVYYQQLQKQYTTVYAEVLEWYQKINPQAQDTEGARAQLEKMLNVGGKNVNNPLFAYLQEMSEPLLNTPGVSLQQLAMQEDSMQAEVIAADFATLGQLEAALEAKGLIVSQENARLEENQVVAQLDISRGQP